MASKLQLSQKETDLVQNTEWILTKTAIIKKVYDLFGELYSFQKNELNGREEFFPAGVVERSGKISKGDNYLGLPYVILDYPALFEKNNLFMIRTMFWWGNFFSVTLHSSGVNRLNVAKKDVQEFLQRNNFFISQSENEWDHHFEKNNYSEAGELIEAGWEKISGRKFVKVAKKISLSHPDNVPEFLMEAFREIIQLVEISSRAGKTGPSPVFPKAGSGL